MQIVKPVKNLNLNFSEKGKMAICQNSLKGKVEIFLDLKRRNRFYHWNRLTKSNTPVEFRYILRLLEFHVLRKKL